MGKQLVFLSGLLIVIGCTPEDSPKTSNFEHDHEVAEHWPDGLADAAVKIRERLDVDPNDTIAIQQAGGELRYFSVDIDPEFDNFITR